jgi:hypothetical protein
LNGLNIKQREQHQVHVVYAFPKRGYDTARSVLQGSG